MYRACISVIHSEGTRRFTVYMVQTRGDPVVVFVLLYVNISLNWRGRRMSEKIKMVIVQYLLMHLSVEAIRSKLRQGQYICITLSNSGDLAKYSE